MKLNLLPTYVSKGKATRTAWIVAGLLILGSALATVWMTVASGKQLADNKAAAEEMKTKADAAVATSNKADEIIGQASGIIRNSKLATAMIQHNPKYPAFYDRFFRYIPPFFRLTSISATPISDTQVSVQMSGVIQSYQQYADLMLAMMRNPKAVSIARTGFTGNDYIVPPLTQADQLGIIRRPNEGPVPQDPIARLEYYQAQGGTTSPLGVGGFGQGQGVRQAGPGYSPISITMVVEDNLQTPNPRATLQGGGGGAPAVGGPPMGVGGPPAGFGGPPAGFGGPPPGAGAPAAGGRAGGGSSRQEDE